MTGPGLACSAGSAFLAQSLNALRMYGSLVNPGLGVAVVGGNSLKVSSTVVALAAKTRRQRADARAIDLMEIIVIC
eukprot:CAMPEP_0174903846 /NCGR_PEP_ID=MMETSP0167-20121228/45902_1 /TAXON_ID=38298 /ORGANISM="Rhodella maculata, Strain CCMP736" /LENGTH=75 /DNA_ID=CAMNT_0016146293 /DNA_START=315 /DNA_END=542 /DNA_ORIENTATION=-